MNATQVNDEADKVKAHFAFGLASGVMPYLGVASEKEEFTVEIRYVVTIVTIKGEGFLKVREGEVKGDIYVLYDTDDCWPAPRPMGWMWASRIKREPAVEGYHALPADSLIAFESLVRMLRQHKNLS